MRSEPAWLKSGECVLKKLMDALGYLDQPTTELRARTIGEGA